MPKGVKYGGRQKGTTNKSTASVKAALEEAFEKLGGVGSLVAWGQSEPTEFYKLWVKLAPIQINAEVTSVSISERLQRARARIGEIAVATVAREAEDDSA